MNKNEFFSFLKINLKNFDETEVSDIIKYYDELIEEKKDAGMSEDEAVASFGDLKSLINQITSDLVINRSTKSPKNNSLRNFWIILGVCGFPILLPIVIILGALGIVLISLLFSFVVTAIAMAASLIPIIIMSIRNGDDVFTILIQVGTYMIAITVILMLLYTIKKYGYLVLNQITKFIASLVKKVSQKGTKGEKNE